MSGEAAGEWVLWLVRRTAGGVSVRAVAHFASQGAAVRHGVRLGRVTPPGPVRYYVRPVGRHLSRDPARYPWARGLATAAGSQPNGRRA